MTPELRSDPPVDVADFQASVKAINGRTCLPRPSRSPVPIAERFWKYVEFTDSCWLWRGSTTKKGYGQISGEPHTQKRFMAYRWLYEFVVGPIPDGLTLDHLCRNRGCVRPDHMEAVTNRVNILRGTSWAAVNARKTHCPRGHSLSDSRTTRIDPATGKRICRACAVVTRRAREGRRMNPHLTSEPKDTRDAIIEDMRESLIRMNQTLDAILLLCGRTDAAVDVLRSDEVKRDWPDWNRRQEPQQ